MTLTLLMTLIFLLSTSASASAQNKMSITWKDKWAKGTVIDRKPGPITDTTTFTMIGKAPPGSNYYADSTITPGQEYCYRTYEDGTKNYSQTTCQKAELTPPKTSTIFTAIAINWVVPPLVKCSPKDWIALYAQGAPDILYLLGLWRYTNCASSGTFAVIPPRAGDYNFRYMLDDGFKSAWISNTVRMTEIGVPVATRAGAQKQQQKKK